LAERFGEEDGVACHVPLPHETRAAGEKYDVCECAVSKISRLLLDWLLSFYLLYVSKHIFVPAFFAHFCISRQKYL